MDLIKRYITIVAAVLVLLSVASCGDEGCFENRTSLPKAGIYASNIAGQAIAVDSISLHGIGAQGDVELLKTSRGVSSLVMPFRNDADTTQFVIRYDMKALAQMNMSDTLTFVYTRYPYFISADCGVTFNYQIDDFRYTTYMLDSAALVVDEVTNVDEETLRLYYYVAQ